MPLQKNLALANRLIAELAPQDRSMLLASCELVELKLQTTVIEAGQPLEHVYFPVDGFVSVLFPQEGTPPVEVALVGSEGMFNAGLLLGAQISAFTILVAGAGRAFRQTRGAFEECLARQTSLRNLLSHYLDVRARQLAQQAACMNYHAVLQRLARALLMARDRAHSAELFLTHEVLALMLGVRRESVSQAAATLQRRGLISYSRGYVMLLDEPAIETVACRCYAADLRVYEETLGGTEEPAPVRVSAFRAGPYPHSPAH